MNKVLLENTKTNRIITCDDKEAIKRINSDSNYKVVKVFGDKEVEKPKQERRDILQIIEVKNIKSPDYEEKESKKLRQTIPMIEVWKFSLFRNKPYIRWQA